MLDCSRLANACQHSSCRNLISTFCIEAESGSSLGRLVANKKLLLLLLLLLPNVDSGVEQQALPIQHTSMLWHMAEQKRRSIVNEEENQSMCFARLTNLKLAIQFQFRFQCPVDRWLACCSGSLLETRMENGVVGCWLLARVEAVSCARYAPATHFKTTPTTTITLTN